MQTCKVRIRWGTRPDMATVVRIDAESYAQPWTDEDFLRRLRERNVILMIAEHDGEPVGYALYVLHRNHITIERMAVDPAWRRCGIGSQLAGKLQGKVSGHRRAWLSIRVAETDLGVQRWLNHRGFVAVGVLPEFYAPDTDGILFHWYLSDGE